MPVSHSGIAMSMSDQPGAMLTEGKTRPAPSTSPLEEGKTKCFTVESNSIK